MIGPLLHQVDPAFGLLPPLSPGVSLDALPEATASLSLASTKLRGIERFARLRTLVIPPGALNKAALAALHGHPGIEHLSLGVKAAPGEALLATLASLPRLRSVRVITENPDAASLLAIAKIPRLGSLEIDGRGKLVAEALAGLEQAPQLHTLRLRRPREFGPALVRAAAAIPSLVVLEVGNPRSASGAAIEALTSLRGLRGLLLPSIGLRADEDFAPLARMASLESLSLNLCPASGKVARYVAQLAGLRSLDLGWSNVEGAELAALGPLAHLEELNLDNTKVPGPVLAELCRRLPLRRLRVGNQPAAPWLDALVERGAVEELSLTNATKAASVVPSLAGLARLRALDLSGLRGETGSLAAIDGVASIERLGMSQLALGDAVVAAVARLPRLRELDLGYVRGVTGAGLRTLTAAVGLRTLGLAGNAEVGPAVAKALVSKLELERLALHGCASIDAATVAALQALRPGMSLTMG